jgi:hypothetical protein
MNVERRRDRLTALIIDAALHTCGTHGVEVAALALRDHGIERETILRVLTVPRQRRGAGQRSRATLLMNAADLVSAPA